MENISKKLVKKVFLSYFAIAAIITTCHIYLVFMAEKERTQKDLLAQQKASYSALAQGLWNYDPDLLKVTLQGIVSSPKIVKASAFNPNDSNPIATAFENQGTSDSDTSEFTFSVTYSSRGQSYDVGHVILTYDSGKILSRTLDHAFGI